MSSFIVVVTGSVNTARTLIQIKSGSTVPLKIVRASCAQENSTTSAMQPIILVKKSSGATITARLPDDLDGDGSIPHTPTGTTETGVMATAEGTDGIIFMNDAFNVLNGWLYLPVPEERIRIIAGDIVAMKFPAPPSTALSIRAEIVFAEE